MTGAPIDRSGFDQDFDQRLERQMEWDKKYRYKQFVTAKVITKGKVAGGIKVNYHRLFGELVFIDKSGDTLLLRENPSIELIQTPADVFCNIRKDGFYRLMSDQVNNPWLVVKEVWKIDKIDPISQNAPRHLSEDIPNTNGYHVRYEPRDQSKTLLDVAFKDGTEYFLITNGRDVERANRNNFIRAFSSHKEEVKQWIDEHNTDFFSEADLRKLYDYCVSLK